jgi:hypothetical protein
MLLVQLLILMLQPLLRLLLKLKLVAEAAT